jgi:hypothetical protein
MARIFVAGPVEKGGGRSGYLDPLARDEVERVYASLQAAATGRADLSIPVQDDRLDKAESREFLAETLSRIARSDCAISVLVKGDRGSVIETVLISAIGKRQIVVSDDPEALPRAVRGLPGVEAVASFEDATYRADEVVSRSLEQASHGSVPESSLLDMTEAVSRSQRVAEA